MGRAVRLIDRDKGWKRIRATVEAIRRQELQVTAGVLGDDGVGQGGLTLPEIAAVNEYGTRDGHIPARSFIRSTFDEMQGRMRARAREMIDQMLLGRMDPITGLEILGGELAQAMKRKILDGPGVPPPNAPSTVMAKLRGSKAWRFFKKPAKTLGQGLARVAAAASVRPLVDTGRMVGAITYAIVRGKRKGSRR